MHVGARSSRETLPITLPPIRKRSRAFSSRSHGALVARATSAVTGMLNRVMCGRVDQHTPPSELARLLEVALAAGVDPEGKPSWNVPPSRGLPVVTEAPPVTDDGQNSGGTK